MALSEQAVAHFRTFGFVVLRRAFDPAPLRAEVDRAFAAAADPGDARRTSAEAGIAFRYLPMMGPRALVSLGLLDACAPLAAALLEGPALPVRAKAVDGPSPRRARRLINRSRGGRAPPASGTRRRHR